MTGIEVRVEGAFTAARAQRTPARLPIKSAGGYSTFTIPRLADYELIVLE